MVYIFKEKMIYILKVYRKFKTYKVLLNNGEILYSNSLIKLRAYCENEYK